MESRGIGKPSAKWIPKGPKRSPSTDAVTANPPWEQEQEVYERLVQELVALETRADARIEAHRRGDAPGAHPPLEADQAAYDKLQATLRDMEGRADAPPHVGAMRRNSSRGALLPLASAGVSMAEAATGVHQRL